MAIFNPETAKGDRWSSLPGRNERESLKIKTGKNGAQFAIKCLPEIYVYVIIGILLMTAGCITVGPDYVSPPIETPKTWHTNLDKELLIDIDGFKTQNDGWSVFNDPVLSDLMDRAVAGNPDLKIAISRLMEARARRGISKAEMYPQLDATGSVKKISSHNENEGDTHRELYASGIDAVWELDIFGGTRRSVEAAQANLESLKGSLGNVQVSLLAETALNYIDLRALQEKLTITSANISSQEETCLLVSWRLSAGLANELELEQARYNLASVRSTKPTLISDLASVQHRLAILLGLPPGSLKEQLQSETGIPVPPLNIALAIPADVLRQRPDVFKAERELAAQNAMIGVAAAKQYPQFSLNGTIGIEAMSANSFFSLDTRTTSFGPRLTWSIFSGGAVKRNIAVQSALKDQALYAYESVILTALEEVENALSAFSKEQDRMSSLFEAVESAREAEQLAKTRYESGLSDFSVVLEAQRSLHSFQSRLVDSKAQAAKNFVTLYKALGGHWQPPE